MSVKSSLKKGKKTKWYEYGIFTPERGPREGEEVVRQERATDTEAPEYIFKSKLNPKQRKESEEMFGYGAEERLAGGGEYADFIKASQKGGEHSSRKKWENEAEKQKAKRAKKDWQAGKELTPEQTELLIRAGVLTKESEQGPIKARRAGAYKYHEDRAASNTERSHKHRAKQKEQENNPDGHD